MLIINSNYNNEQALEGTDRHRKGPSSQGNQWARTYLGAGEGNTLLIRPFTMVGLCDGGLIPLGVTHDSSMRCSHDDRLSGGLSAADNTVRYHRVNIT